MSDEPKSQDPYDTHVQNYSTTHPYDSYDHGDDTHILGQRTTDKNSKTDPSKSMGIHPIDLTGGNHPILTPRQFRFIILLG